MKLVTNPGHTLSIWSAEFSTDLLTRLTYQAICTSTTHISTSSHRLLGYEVRTMHMGSWTRFG